MAPECRVWFLLLGHLGWKGGNWLFCKAFLCKVFMLCYFVLTLSHFVLTALPPQPDAIIHDYIMIWWLRHLLFQCKNCPYGLKPWLKKQADYTWISIRGFINHKSEATWKMASFLDVCSVFVRGCAASGYIVMPFWTAALILMSLSTSWPTWQSTGLFSTAGRCRRSAEGTARGLHTNPCTHTQTLALKHLQAWKHNCIPTSRTCS